MPIPIEPSPEWIKRYQHPSMHVYHEIGFEAHTKI